MSDIFEIIYCKFRTLAFVCAPSFDVHLVRLRFWNKSDRNRIYARDYHRVLNRMIFSGVSRIWNLHREKPTSNAIYRVQSHACLSHFSSGMSCRNAGTKISFHVSVSFCASLACSRSCCRFRFHHHCWLIFYAFCSIGDAHLYVIWMCGIWRHLPFLGICYFCHVIVATIINWWMFTIRLEMRVQTVLIHKWFTCKNDFVWLNSKNPMRWYVRASNTHRILCIQSSSPHRVLYDDMNNDYAECGCSQMSNRRFRTSAFLCAQLACARPFLLWTRNGCNNIGICAPGYHPVLNARYRQHAL